MTSIVMFLLGGLTGALSIGYLWEESKRKHADMLKLIMARHIGRTDGRWLNDVQRHVNFLEGRAPNGT